MKNYQKVKTTNRALKRTTDALQVRNLIILTGKLYSIYRYINKRLFDDILPISQITFYPKDGCYGEIYIHQYENRPILVLNCDHLNLGVKHIIEVITHEMVHLYCHVNNIKEYDYNTGYHNKNFKKVCNSIGMECSKSDKYGYNIVKLPLKQHDIFNKFLSDKKLEQLILQYNYS